MTLSVVSRPENHRVSSEEESELKAPNRLKTWLDCRQSNRMPWWVRVLIRVRVWPALHYCLDWDGLCIDNHDGEYINCTCLNPKPSMSAKVRQEMEEFDRRLDEVRPKVDAALERWRAAKP